MVQASASQPKFSLEKRMRERGVSRVAICGCMTQMCCDTTARQAFHLGFQVDFLSDATGTLSVQNSAGSISDRDLRRAVLVTMAAKFARVMRTEEWIGERIMGRGGALLKSDNRRLADNFRDLWRMLLNLRDFSVAFTHDRIVKG